MTKLFNIFLKVNETPKIPILLFPFYILVCCVISTQGFFQSFIFIVQVQIFVFYLMFFFNLIYFLVLFLLFHLLTVNMFN